VSVLAGAATLALVLRRRFEPARFSGALAVTTVIAGWAFARYPTLLPGLTVGQAAASHDALVCLVVAVLAGGAILFPSLALLFRLTLSGGFDPGAGEPEAVTRGIAGPLGPGASARLAIALLVVGVGLLNAADAPWAHALGVLSLFGFMIVGFAAIVPGALTEDD
jgi:cytochrome bd ubiquinol oxidase subunit II